MTTEPELTDEQQVQAARELVLRHTGEPTETPTIALDAYAPLFGEMAECKAAVAFWSDRLNRLKDALRAVLGDAHVGTINGEPAVTYVPTNSFNETDFRRRYPSMARVYMHTVSKDVLNVEALKLTRPELYAEFQVRPLRVTYEPPGTPKAGP